MSERFFAGQFLVATPVITHPPFDRTVVFLLDHDEAGAIGVIINRPTDLPVSDALDPLDARLSDPPTIFLGGPVDADSAVALARGRDLPFLQPTPLAHVGLVDIEAPLPDTDDLRIYAGYAGWSAGQLELELGEGAWWVLPAMVAEIFQADTTDIWSTAVQRGPGVIPLYATYPSDPSLN